MRDALLSMIAGLSYREGDFTLSSGLKSSFYIDLKPTILHPEGATLFGSLGVDWMLKEKLNFDGVGGLTLGADPLVMAFSLAAFRKGIFVPATMIRKEPKKHGTSRFIEGVENFKPGARFLVLEDVVTTGGSALKAIEILRNEGFTATHVLALVDREAGGREKFKSIGVEFHSLFTIRDVAACYHREH
ncbi:MAG: orotate phosphoribosyltransferase [Bdellovibrionales bacterium]|nr:orotate phosphoribosyltransferase [Bdellovibrionales bacterium]